MTLCILHSFIRLSMHIKSEMRRLSADNWYWPINSQFGDNRYRPFDNRAIICFFILFYFHCSVYLYILDTPFGCQWNHFKSDAMTYETILAMRFAIATLLCCISQHNIVAIAKRMARRYIDSQYPYPSPSHSITVLSPSRSAGASRSP